MTHWLLLGLTLGTAVDAAAQDTPHTPEHGTGAHGSAVDDAAALGEAGHGGGGGAAAHVSYYTDDDDHDGIANWRDPMNGTEPNTHSYILWSVGFHALNLGLLLAVLAWVARRPIADTFRDRALTIRNDLTESARRRDEAHQRHQDLLARLEKIEGEVQKMEQDADADAKREEDNLVARAHQEAARVLEQAERNIRDETTRARTELRKEAVELAVQLAESRLRRDVSTTDHQNLAREFLRSVKGGDHV